MYTDQFKGQQFVLIFQYLVLQPTKKIVDEATNMEHQCVQKKFIAHNHRVRLLHLPCACPSVPSASAKHIDVRKKKKYHE
jgi:hypothetical protein